MTEKIRKLCVVIPLYNEDKNVKYVYESIQSALHAFNIDFLFVDDGSSDDTLNVLRRLKYDKSNMSYVSLLSNHGKETAIIAGLRSLPPSYDAVLVMDGDGQHTGEMALRMISAANNEGCQVVFGTRENRAYQSSVQRLLSNCFYFVFNSLSQIAIEPAVGDFNLYRSKALNCLLRYADKSLFLKGIYGVLAQYPHVKIPIEIAKRVGGQSAFSIFKRVGLAITAFTSFSNIPLRIIAVFGIALSAFSGILICITLLEYVLKGVSVPGYYTLLVVNAFFFGLLFVFMGIIGEYLGRVFEEVKGRPPYFIKEQVGKNIQTDDRGLLFR